MPQFARSGLTTLDHLSHRERQGACCAEQSNDKRIIVRTRGGTSRRGATAFSRGGLQLCIPDMRGKPLSLPCAWPRPPSLAALRQFTLKEGGICRRQKTEGLLIAAFAAEAALQSPTAYRRSPLYTRGPWVRVKYGANLAKNVHKRHTRQTTTDTRGGRSGRYHRAAFVFAPAARRRKVRYAPLAVRPLRPHFARPPLP